MNFLDWIVLGFNLNLHDTYQPVNNEIISTTYVFGSVHDYSKLSMVHDSLAYLHLKPLNRWVGLCEPGFIETTINHL